MRAWLMPAGLFLAGMAVASLIISRSSDATQTRKADSATAYIAVATNFRTTADQLVAAFTRTHRHQLIVVSGATGKLFNQITQGAPFDVFLSADHERARRLLDEGRALPGSQKTYAFGRLVLLGTQRDPLHTLQNNQYQRLAMANPKLAPYGLAATQTLDTLGLSQAAAAKTVMGENVGQAYAMVATGNADLAFVALSMLKPAQKSRSWLVPTDHHEPIRQDLVLLEKGARNPAALAFLAFLDSDAAISIIEDAGYQVKIP
ncbi:MAG: molybdate ABC transporter substrate-binding protein [bacterium]